MKTKLVIVGLEYSGKTALFEFIKSGNFIETQPTEGKVVVYMIRI